MLPVTARALALVLVLGLCTIQACRDGSLPTQAPNVTSIELSVATTDVTVGDSVPVSARLNAGGGTGAIDGPAVTWTTSDSAVATVSSTGALTGLIRTVSAGVVTIRASTAGISAGVTLGVTAARPRSQPLAFIWTEQGGISALRMPVGAISSTASAINDRGTVAGTIRIGATDHATIWTAAGDPVDLDDFLDGVQSSATAINMAGDVVGSFSLAGSAPHAFVWTPGTQPIDIGVLPRDVSSNARAINNSGVVVGVSWSDQGIRHAFRWSAADGMRKLDPLPNDVSADAEAIDDNGDVVGASSDENTDENTKAAMWTALGQRVVLVPCSGVFGCYANAAAISNGMVVGSAQFYGGGYPSHAFRLTGSGNVADLGFLPGTIGSYAAAVNALGQVVGASGATQLSRAVLWTPTGSIRSIGKLPSCSSSAATGINTSGTVVGYCQ